MTGVGVTTLLFSMSKLASFSCLWYASIDLVVLLERVMICLPNFCKEEMASDAPGMFWTIFQRTPKNSGEGNLKSLKLPSMSQRTWSKELKKFSSSWMVRVVRSLMVIFVLPPTVLERSI